MERHVIGGHTIEPGSLVIMSQWVVHHDARWWTNPNEFLPERWMMSAPSAALGSSAPSAARPKYAYFPFGGGSRICIGESFAWTEAILLLATIAQRWRFEAETQPSMEPRITLRPTNLRMRPTRR